jgi:hypothetical protein
MYLLIHHTFPEKVVPFDAFHVFPLHQLVGCTGFDIRNRLLSQQRILYSEFFPRLASTFQELIIFFYRLYSSCAIKLRRA